MRTGSGLLLVDWDSALIAPPERDLWVLDAGDGAIVREYEDRTERTVSADALDMNRLWYDLAEIAIYIAEFRRAHGDDPNTRESWKNLQEFLDPVPRWPQLVG
jgi:spectinomycin phosphotransferase/16S rRNA (guanine(1405)-N(7))-methyltransferase